jgi:hypothetical protein
MININNIILLAAYNSATHFCCDTPHAYGSGEACCYVRKNDGDSLEHPTPYNINTHCCNYPYNAVVPKPINTDCATIDIDSTKN